MPQEIVTTTQPVIHPVGINLDIFGGLFELLSSGGLAGFIERLGTWWTVYSVIAILLSLLFFMGFVYSKIRLTQIHEVQEQNLHDAEAIWAERHRVGGTRNARWDGIQQKVAENNPESWRIAIIEADILLDEVLTNAGYVGQSLGEKLKTANPQSFRTIQDAWEAHKVRNEIAHVGSDFILTQKTARETLLRFERVFKEFDVI